MTRGLGGAVDAFAAALRAAPRHLAAWLTLTVVAGACPVLAAWLTKSVLDELVRPEPGTAAALRTVVLLASVGVAAAALPALATYLSAQAHRRIGMTAQDRLYRKINDFDGLARFEDPTFLDRLRTARQAGEQAPARVVDSVVSIARAGITVGGLTLVVWTVNPACAVLVLLAAVPVLVAELTLARHRAATQHGIGPAERREFFYGSLLTTVQAAKEIRLFGLGDHFRERMRRERGAADRARARVDRRTVLTQCSMAVLAATVSGAGLLWVVIAAVRGEVTVGDVTMFVAAIAAAQSGLAGVAASVASAHQALLEYDHYRAVLSAESDLVRITAPRRLEPLRDRIELRDVWFRYSPDHPWVLRGVNLAISAGQSLAVVGANGAGKSTLVKLLCRFYDPTRGVILWDGTDLREVPVADLRNRLGAVFQDYMEYDLTAAENIGLGDLPAIDDPQRIRGAAAEAEIHQTLSTLPAGYSTMLSRMFVDELNPLTGVSLSGGQWQRVALARSYLRMNPDLLILDEPSAGLDPEAESRIHRRLRDRRAGRASVLISHRLGTLRDADHIVVLSDGVVAETGKHDELMARDGIYSRLFLLQASGYAAEPDDLEPRLEV